MIENTRTRTIGPDASTPLSSFWSNRCRTLEASGFERSAPETAGPTVCFTKAVTLPSSAAVADVSARCCRNQLSATANAHAIASPTKRGHFELLRTFVPPIIPATTRRMEGAVRPPS